MRDVNTTEAKYVRCHLKWRTWPDLEVGLHCSTAQIFDVRFGYLPVTGTPTVAQCTLRNHNKFSFHYSTAHPFAGKLLYRFAVHHGHMSFSQYVTLSVALTITYQNKCAFSWSFNNNNMEQEEQEERKWNEKVWRDWVSEWVSDDDDGKWHVMRTSDNRRRRCKQL